MSTEVFRFVTIRPPRPASDSAGDDTVDLGQSKGKLIASLRNARPSGSRAALEKLAVGYVGTTDFLGMPGRIDPAMLALVRALQQLGDTGFADAAAAAIQSRLGQDAAGYAAGDAFAALCQRSCDSLVAATIDSDVAPRSRMLLARLARTLWLIRRLASGQAVTRAAFLGAPMVLPAGIFPLPSTSDDLKATRQAQADAAKAASDARNKEMAQLAADLAARRDAREELLGAFERAGAQPAAKPAGRKAVALSAPNPSGFVLSDTAAGALSASTRTTLADLGIGATGVDVAKSVTLLEKSAAGIASRLYADTGAARQMVKIGSNFVPSDALAGGYGVIIDPLPIVPRTPGPCAPTLDQTPPDSEPTVPNGKGDARVLGIADLLVVEQALLRYQLGEIAHVENVLKSEVRSRRFKTSDSTQQTDTTETESTTDKEQDLSTSERFELQTESQTVISQTASKDAGLTIHASYGPSVDATANYNSSSSTSTQQSNTASSNYAREVATKAVERIQTRTLTSRTVTTIHVVEEVNEHAFDNKAGTADIVGVYRYLDKIYQAQVVNYGKRLMLEFIVPEPAAFLRYAMSNRPVDDITQTNPDAPGYCVGGQTFQPLQASDITRDNYLYWASKYGAQDVNPPPPSVVIASGSKKAPDQMPTVGDRLLSSDMFDITIADGYLCQSAYVNIYGETQAGVHRIFFQLQEQQGEYIEPNDDHAIWTLHLLPTPTLTVTVNSIGFHNYEVLVTVFCSLSTEKFQDWQLKTFSSIMNAYNDQKSAYDQAVAEAKLRASDSGVTGTNPDINRATEQIELKKGCISLLTGQRFDFFDAVARNVAPYGYPEIDFAEAKAEGAYIAVFEQSFEWNNMVYLFYPYFWGKKDDWATVAQLRDIDPLFTQFLQAGAARVKVPVRRGFEEAILSYLASGELPGTDGVLVNADDYGPDDTQLSIIDELKSQQGDNNTDGQGTINLTHGSAAVSGTGTAFSQDDVGRRLIVGGATYVIQSAADAQTITLSAPYDGQSAQGQGYALGGVLVGQPWEVRLPTDLVKLDNSLVIN